jgi:hypothetical protein
MPCGQLNSELKMSLSARDIFGSNKVDHISLGHFQFFDDSGYIHDFSQSVHGPVVIPREKSCDQIAPAYLRLFQGLRYRLIGFLSFQEKFLSCIHPEKRLIQQMTDDPKTQVVEKGRAAYDSQQPIFFLVISENLVLIVGSNRSDFRQGSIDGSS